MTERTQSAQAYRVQTRTRLSAIAAVAGAGLFVLLLLAPAFASRSVLQDLLFILTMLTLAQYWNLLAGYAGLVSVGQQAFVGIGAYGLFASTILLGIDPVPAAILAGVVAMALAVPTAFVIFRLRGAYFAIGTWVAAEVFRLIFAQWKSLGGGTGTSLPRDATSDFLGADLIKSLLDVKTSAARDIAAYWLALLLAAGTIVLVYALLRSRYGLALSAVRDAEGAARSLGVRNFRTKVWIYVVSAFGTGVAGALIYFQKARVSPDSAFSVIDWTAFVVFIVVIGGIGTIEGPILGVLVFFVLQNYFADYGTWYLMALGIIATIVMLVAPQGLWGLISKRYGVQLFPVQRRLFRDDYSEDDRPENAPD